MRSPAITDPTLQSELHNKQNRLRIVYQLSGQAPDEDQVVYIDPDGNKQLCTRVEGEWFCISAPVEATTPEPTETEPTTSEAPSGVVFPTEVDGVSYDETPDYPFPAGIDEPLYDEAPDLPFPTEV